MDWTVTGYGHGHVKFLNWPFFLSNIISLLDAGSVIQPQLANLTALIQYITHLNQLEEKKEKKWV